MSISPEPNVRHDSVTYLYILTLRSRKDQTIIRRPESLLPFLIMEAYIDDSSSRASAVSLIARLEPRALRFVLPVLLRAHFFPRRGSSDRRWSALLLDQMGLQDFRNEWLYRQAVSNDYLNGLLGFDVFAR
jgi:hypothetical protein